MENSSGALAQAMWKLFSDQKWEESKQLFHEKFVAEWPQSRERFLGANNFVDMNAAYPGNHTIEVLDILASDNRVVTAVYIHADTGQKAFATSFFELKDNKILKLTEFWGEPYDAPAWREKYVVRF